MRLPSKKTSPLVGSRNPPIILSVVVLPQPDGPRKVTNSLSLISRLIFFQDTLAVLKNDLDVLQINNIFHKYPDPSAKIKSAAFVSQQK